jgi:hypothetical protein
LRLVKSPSDRKWPMKPICSSNLVLHTLSWVQEVVSRTRTFSGHKLPFRQTIIRMISKKKRERRPTCTREATKKFRCRVSEKSMICTFPNWN